MGTPTRLTPEEGPGSVFREGGSRTRQRWMLSSLGPGTRVAPRAVQNREGG